MGNFVHLHLHTEYSLLDGAARIKRVVQVAKSMGMPAIAMTDHGNMYGAVKMFDECKKQDVKPIIGCEFYVCDDLHVKSGKVKLAHLICLAKDETGYKNLCKLNSVAFCEGFYYKPRIDYKLLEQYKEGLIVLSACLAGDIPQLILKRQFDEAEKLVKWFKDTFGDDFYLELQNHGLAEQVEVNHMLHEYAKKYNIKMVATNDVHYINREDAEVQDVLMCVQMGKTLDDPDRMKFPNDEFYFKSYEEMQAAFPNDEEALATTLEIADKCNYAFEFGHYLYPKYNPVTGQDPVDYLRDLVEAGIIRRYGKETKEIRDRVEYEFGVIQKTGYIEYYLIVWDYINAARKMGCAVGPGRGSGVGSIIAYLIGITDVDPLKYGLFFERFLNPKRVSAPDFDIDFEDSRRQDVIDYVREKYGDERVVKIITFGTMAAKNAIKDVGRVLKIPYSEMDRVTKNIPNTVKRPNIIAKVFGIKPGDKGQDESVPELVAMYNENEDIKRVIDIAWKLEDSPRQTGIHACGVIIGGDVLDKHLPLAKNADDVTTQFEGGELERLGHLKMDFLGLRNLSDVKNAIEYVKQNHGIEINFENSDYADPNVYKLISTGNTKGIFQIESAGFQKFMKELQPTCLEDIIAGVSLYRPGPMDSIPTFVKNKHNPEGITYVSPLMKPILDVTYGCIVYQEQVMQLVQALAGYTLSRADAVRKYMGKKKLADLKAEREVFIHGCEAKGNSKAVDGVLKRGTMDEATANKLWDEMEKFGSYAFNKSHAAAYSYITYQTAYLKTYYEPEFLTSVLNNRITNQDEIKNYIAYAKSEKIEVLPPDINKSGVYFTVKDGKIRFGLAALKNVGIAVMESVIAEREANGEFKDLNDFISRVDAQAQNKRCVESLILSGAFDSFGVKRSQLMHVYAGVIERVQQDRKKAATGQFSLFDGLETDDFANTIVYPNIDEFDNATKLKLEKDVVGVYISGHPLSGYLNKFREYNLTADMLDSGEVEEMQVDDEDVEQVVEYDGLSDGMDVTCGGIITEIKKLFTKNGNKEMAFAKLEDLYGTIDLMFFPNVYARLKEELKEDSMVTVKGKLSIREGEAPSVLVDSITPWESENAETEGKQKTEEKPKTLYLKYNLTDKNLHASIFEVLKNYLGAIPVIVKCSADNKTYKLNLCVDGSNNLINELMAYIPEEFIKLV